MSKAASLSPENFVEGGGLIDDVDVEFKECVFDMFDYNGKVVPGVPSLKVTMVIEEDEAIQYYSMGSSNDWIPSEDGSQLLAVGKATNIRMTSNGGIFLKSLIDAGFPADQLGDDITVLQGLQAHVIRVPAPKRPGIKKEKKDFEDTILIVSDIISLPGEKKKPKGAPKGAAKSKAKGKAKPKAKPTVEEAVEEAADSGDINDKATVAIMEILEAEGSVTKKELPAKIFQTMKADPDRNAIVKIVFDDEFLESGPWTYEDGEITG